MRNTFFLLVFFSDFVVVVLFTAVWMEKIEKYRTMDTVLSNIQEAALSMGSISWPSGKFQSWPRSGNGSQEIMPQRRAVLSCEYISDVHIALIQIIDNIPATKCVSLLNYSF